ncbi:MAG TPA: hypothetical protein VFG15_00105 [Amycolatopsis sp.]|nr:hypothetical protein [Amycolatopsis sp.]
MIRPAAGTTLHRTIEILDDLDIFTRPDVDPPTLSLAGVRVGAKAADTVALDRVIKVTHDGVVHFADKFSVKNSLRCSEHPIWWRSASSAVS